MGGTNGLLLLPLEGESWPPGEHSFGSRPLFPGILPDWVNNHAAQAVIAAALVIAFWLWMSRNQKIVPTRRQAIGETFYDLVRNGIARDILGHDFRRYLPFLLALFSFILVNNLFGQFFIFMFPTFSKIGFAWGLALCAWVLYNGAGIRKWGLFGYLKHATLPAGVPKPLWFLIIPLEFLSNIIVRPLTLGLRLFANLFAGHLVIMVFVVGGTMLLTATQTLEGFPVPLLNVAGVVSILFSFAIFALELLVGSIQAYIFTVLTAQYVASATADDH
ncbi:F0F1 ATP synthase subunit A [Propioniciclava coleopterorum]|uniref:ATP synthase subunit a n=1 Tax=Propioniciclava coleopterorum TaxID=2714937 RepID=A0A6G7Y950_9ACTN|nr:F0F1 ATP synthase subunit A [Propioniciclava coleopterorum]QIK73323.1 F0F1 ATP synthase subunit A [Propioniciclava coleopterorum]